MKKKLEICCYSVESGISAEESGADRIELCDNYSEGGTTPSYAAVKYCVENLTIPVNVMVRPRGGDFLYTDVEYEIMKSDVLQTKELNANGVVIGFLRNDGNIDFKRTKEIVDLAKPMEVTFHRAFDMCRDHLSALEELKGIGVTRVLTSGAKYTVTEGVDLISDLVNKAEDKIIIMPGCGVNDKNLKELMIRTGANEFHTASKMFEKSKMNYFNNDVSMGRVEDISEYSKVVLDTDRVKKMVEILNR